MPDREKVIKQIANCVHDGLCDGCEYKKYTACRHFMIADALALLKEQQREIEILKAMGLKMPEITVLTDKPIYKVDT